MAAVGAYQSAAPAPLKVPKRYQSFSSHSALLSSPSPFGRSNSALKSPLPSSTPTPKPRPRPPDTPAWFSILLLQTLPLYIAYTWLTATSPPAIATTVTLAFLTLLGSTLGFTISQYHGNTSSSPASSTSLTSALWILCSGIMVATSAVLRIQGLRSCGPLVAVMADYGGTALGKFVTGNRFLTSTPASTSTTARTFRGFMAIAAGLIVMQQGWTIESCSPLSIKAFYHGATTTSCNNVGPVWPSAAAGLLTSLANAAAARSLLRRSSSSKKRAQGLANVAATLLLLPLAMLQLQSLAFVRASAWWPLANMLSLGLARSLHSEAHFEEKLLMPYGSLRHFGITAASLGLLELWFGLDVSPAGFVVCTFMLGFGVRSLLHISSAAAFSWESIADRDASAAFSAWVTGPLRHIYSDKKSRKIAVFLAMNTAFMFVEFIYGFASNSLGLVSDACHMLFDCAALAIGLYASYISKLQPSGTFSYGYARFEVLSGYANAVFLVLVASLIVLESIERILEPPEVSTESLLVVSVGGLLVNMVGLIFFHEEHHHAHGGHSGGRSCNHGHHHETLKSEVVEVPNVVHLQHHHHSCEEHHHHHHGEPDDAHQLRQRANHEHHDHETCSGHNHHNGNHVEVHNHAEPGAASLDNHHHGNHAETYHHHEDHHSEHHDEDQNHAGDHHRSLCQNHDHQHHHDDHAGCGHKHHDHAKTDHHQHNHGEANAHKHHHQHIDHNMQGIFLHVLADTLGSVGVVISTLLIQYKGWMFMDATCSIFISVMIIASVIPLLKNSAEILLQRTPRQMEKGLQEALERVRHVPGLGGFERLHTWSLTNEEIVGTFRLHAMTGVDKRSLRGQVSHILHEAGITDLTIQVEEIM